MAAYKRAVKRAGAMLPAKRASAFAPRAATSPSVTSTLRNRGRQIDRAVDEMVNGVPVVRRE
jgi:hypothetical protein